MATLNSFKKKGKRKSAHPLVSFKQKLQRESLSRGQQVIFHPSREEKMSDVLLEFIAPYVQSAETEDAYRKLLTISIVAWNAALFAPGKRKVMINDLLKEMKLGFWERRDFHGVIEMMVERKLKHFAANKRLIVNYELEDLGDQIHLSVASTLAVDEGSRS